MRVNLLWAAAFLLIGRGTALADPELRRVVLSSGGVGQFEFQGEVDGAASLLLDVPLDQVDDVLKSLVVEDPAGPFLGVRLPGRQPLSESFRTLPFKPEAFASAEALLASLVGESVRVPAAGISGVILSVSGFDMPGAAGQTSVTRHRLAIATESGISTVVLEDTPDITLASDALRAQVAAALSAIAAQRVQDRRTLVLSLRPGERRQVRFGYVVPVPVWKTSYRLTLPADASGQAHLQAYAVVENLSGRDWKDVSVTLTSGRPVLFHTPLYQSVFAARPEAPVDVQGALAPSVDSFASITAMPMAAPAPAPPPFIPPPEINVQAPRAARMDIQAGARGRMEGSLLGGAAGTSEIEPPSAVAQSVANVEFRLASGVTAGSGQSLLLPILDRMIPAQRVALYQQDADRVHPLVALRVTNDSQGALPAGLVTLFDRHADGTESYVGDARLPSIQPGEDRLASFATDLAVTVDRTQSGGTSIVGGHAAGGHMTLLRKARDVTTYRVTTPKGEGRTVLIEQPRYGAAELVEPVGKGVTMTPEAYRVSRDVPAGTTQTITLVTERTLAEAYALDATDPAEMFATASGGSIPGPVRDALRHAAELREAVDRAQAALAALQARESAITSDQGRVRNNLYSVPAGSDLQRRYLATLKTQEDQLAALRTQIDAARTRSDDAAGALRDYVAGLRL